MGAGKRAALYVTVGVIALAGLSVVLGGQVPLSDVTGAEEYKVVVGQRFTLRQDLLALGVTADRNYKKQIDYVVLAAPPGFSGPEVVAKDMVAKGTELRVLRVIRSSIPLLSRVYYVVEVAGATTLQGASVRVLQTGATTDANLGLNKELYARVD